MTQKQDGGAHVADLVAAGSFGALLVGGVVVTAIFAWSGVPRPEGRDVVDGRYTARLEKRYEDELAFRDPAVRAFNTLTLSAFGEVSKGAVLGRDGWMFTREEFDETPDAAARTQAAIAYIREVDEALSARGARLVVALVPAKAVVHPERLGGDERWVAAARETYTNALGSVRDGLTDDGLADDGLADSDRVPDLQSVLLASREAGQDVFLQRDTHWNVAGAGLVARALAGGTSARETPAEDAYRIVEGDPIALEGDLASFTKSFLPGAERESIVPLLVEPVDAGLDGFLDGGTEGNAVALVGTSYSANPNWSFASQLQHALQREVVNFAQEGKGPFEPMADFLRRIEEGGKRSPYELVIWEIPIRYLDDETASTLQKLGTKAGLRDGS